MRYGCVTGIATDWKNGYGLHVLYIHNFAFRKLRFILRSEFLCQKWVSCPEVRFLVRIIRFFLQKMGGLCVPSQTTSGN